ncbi:hypothetical protein ABK040_016466 [Willaertia magna]
MASRISQDFFVKIILNHQSYNHVHAATINSNLLENIDNDQQEAAATMVLNSEESNNNSYMKVMIEKYPIKRSSSKIDQYLEEQVTFIAPLSLPKVVTTITNNNETINATITSNDKKKKKNNKQQGNEQVVYYPIGSFIKGLQEEESKKYTYYIQLEVCVEGNVKKMNEKVTFHTKGKDNTIICDCTTTIDQGLILDKIHKSKTKNQVIYSLDQLKIDMKQSNEDVLSIDTNDHCAASTSSASTSNYSTNTIVVDTNVANDDEIKSYFNDANDYDLNSLLEGDGMDEINYIINTIDDMDETIYEKASKKPCFNDNYSNNDFNVDDFIKLLNDN